MVTDRKLQCGVSCSVAAAADSVHMLPRPRRVHLDVLTITKTLESEILLISLIYSFYIVQIHLHITFPIIKKLLIHPSSSTFDSKPCQMTKWHLLPLNWRQTPASGPLLPRPLLQLPHPRPSPPPSVNRQRY